MERTITGGRVNREYVETRARWEPLYEATQIKGDGETHPYLSPDDEFADYETWAVGNLDLSELKEDRMFAGEYARRALQSGLQLEEKFGTNPYKFGLMAATDTHTALSTAEEENFFGKHSGAEPSAKRVYHPMARIGDNEYPGWSMVASGYQGIWATENTREALFDAMMRKETYATTGSRLTVRFFGGWNFNESDVRSRAPAFRGYEKGVPMGGDLASATDGKAPSFMVFALRDPIGANLDRIQIIKGWLDEKGNTHERIYDVAVSGDRQIKADGRAEYPVGNTVDVDTATYTNTIGNALMSAYWTDPDFDPAEHAFYYVRVFEIPTPRWTTYDAARNNLPLSPLVPATLQERAWSSPIWYTPGG